MFLQTINDTDPTVSERRDSDINSVLKICICALKCFAKEIVILLFSEQVKILNLGGNEAEFEVMFMEDIGIIFQIEGCCQPGFEKLPSCGVKGVIDSPVSGFQVRLSSSQLLVAGQWNTP